MFLHFAFPMILWTFYKVLAIHTYKKYCTLKDFMVLVSFLFLVHSSAMLLLQV